eukprot:Em0007g638a
MAHPAHVSLPKPFASGNVHEWFVWFDICSDAKKWDDDTKAVKLPTLLEGEALAAWLEISTEAKETYAKTKKELLTALSSTSFNILEKFQRKMFPGEALPVFLHDIKQLLEQAMPGLDAEAKEQLLLHQFVAGLPPAFSKPLRAAGNTTDLWSTVERAKLLNALENEQQTAGKLSKSARIQRPVSGKLQRGACRGQQTPCTPVSPIEAAFVASIKSTSVVNGLVGGIMVEVMLDSGSSVSLVRHDIAKRLKGTTSPGDAPKIRLISAGGEEITIVNHIKASVEIRGIDKVREHTFIVVEQLISQVILGVDFLQQQYLVLDFTTSPVSVTTSRNSYKTPACCTRTTTACRNRKHCRLFGKQREKGKKSRRGYASRTLTRAEANYSVIQRECLAIVWAMKQFRHYLLGRIFQLMTDHAPLQWLAAQKMEGLLCRWALAIQEFSFEIVYRKGIANGNADALSRREPEMETPHAAMNTVYAGFTPEELTKAQKQDDAIQQLRYKPGPTSDTIVVPVLPEALHQKAMSLCHDSPTAGHQGTLILKTWERIRQEAYWVNMAQDIDRHCRECVTCQKAKLPMPVRSTLTNIPIGRPWQMIAIDILEVPVSTKNNRYLLVIQDYFTKWADARPLKDQTAVRIKAELVML